MKILTTQLAPHLSDLLCTLLLDLGAPSILLRLKLQVMDMLSCVLHGFAGVHKGTLGIAFGLLGAHHAFARGGDAGVFRLAVPRLGHYLAGVTR